MKFVAYTGIAVICVAKSVKREVRQEIGCSKVLRNVLCIVCKVSRLCRILHSLTFCKMKEVALGAFDKAGKRLAHSLQSIEYLFDQGARYVRKSTAFSTKYLMAVVPDDYDGSLKVFWRIVGLAWSQVGDWSYQFCRTSCSNLLFPTILLYSANLHSASILSAWQPN